MPRQGHDNGQTPALRIGLTYDLRGDYRSRGWSNSATGASWWALSATSPRRWSPARARTWSSTPPRASAGSAARPRYRPCWTSTASTTPSATRSPTRCAGTRAWRNGSCGTRGCPPRRSPSCPPRRSSPDSICRTRSSSNPCREQQGHHGGQPRRQPRATALRVRAPVARRTFPPGWEFTVGLLGTGASAGARGRRDRGRRLGQPRLLLHHEGQAAGALPPVLGTRPRGEPGRGDRAGRMAAPRRQGRRADRPAGRRTRRSPVPRSQLPARAAAGLLLPGRPRAGSRDLPRPDRGDRPLSTVPPPRTARAG